MRSRIKVAAGQYPPNGSKRWKTRARRFFNPEPLALLRPPRHVRRLSLRHRQRLSPPRRHKVHSHRLDQGADPLLSHRRPRPQCRGEHRQAQGRSPHAPRPLRLQRHRRRPVLGPRSNRQPTVLPPPGEVEEIHLLECISRWPCC